MVRWIADEPDQGGRYIDSKYTTNMSAFEVEFRDMFNDPLGLRFEIHQNHGVQRVYGRDTPSVDTIRESSISLMARR